MDKHYRRKYGITLEDYNKLYSNQNGCCSICHRPQFELEKTLSVDHDHITGKVRGLLCNGCNGRLAWFEKYKFPVEEYLSCQL